MNQIQSNSNPRIRVSLWENHFFSSSTITCETENVAIIEDNGYLANISICFLHIGTCFSWYTDINQVLSILCNVYIILFPDRENKKADRKKKWILTTTQLLTSAASYLILLALSTNESDGHKNKRESTLF